MTHWISLSEPNNINGYFLNLVFCFVWITRFVFMLDNVGLSYMSLLTQF